MQPPEREPDEQAPDFSSTDTLPLPILRADDTGELEALGLPEEAPEEVPVRIRPRVVVQDPMAATDTFHPSSLAPVAVARPVDTTALAEALREHEQELDRARQRIAALEGQLAEAQRRGEELEARLAESEQPATAVTAPEAAPAAGATQARQQAGADLHELEALRRQNLRLHEALSTVEARMGVREAMLFEAEEALRAAQSAPQARAAQALSASAAAGDATGEAAPDAPADAPAEAAAASADVPREGGLRIDWQARFIELEKVHEADRAAADEKAREYEQRLAELQAALEAERNRQPACAAPAAAAQGTPVPIGTVLRVLVREEDGTEFVYPLGRHTTIGRTPDNDIQVNTTFVSRHHAVLLTSNEHCIVEDLNSTNGIAVNGQRIDRALLRDGDVLTIGRTHFRYEIRK